MFRNKSIAIVVAALLLVFAIVASVTEYRDVSAYDWEERYNYDDEEPQGLYIFKELTNRYFEDIPVTTNSALNDSLTHNSLYIQFTSIHLDSVVIDSLLSIASMGNDVLIIADFLNERIVDKIPNFFDDIYSYDSTLIFNITNKDLVSETNYIYKFHNEEFEQKKVSNNLMQGLDWESDKQYVRVATPDSMALMISFPIGQGRLFYHVKKDFFYNYSYRQSQMFDYTQRVYAHFDPEHIYLLTPLTRFNTENYLNSNPLDFIMSQPALKAAYYLLLIGTLLFVFFGGKRKQKIIPVIEKNENTSLEYIETVSQLFYQQEQHEKLVTHMRNIFYHKMQKKFYVSPTDPNYVKILAKKSKISSTELQYIMDRFKNLDDNFGFRGDQLVSLNRRLESIYKEIETNFQKSNK